MSTNCSMVDDAIARFRARVHPIRLTLVAFVVALGLQFSFRNWSVSEPVFTVALPAAEIALARSTLLEILPGRLRVWQILAGAAIAVVGLCLYQAAVLVLYNHLSLSDLHEKATIYEVAAYGFTGPFIEEVFFQVGVQTALERFGPALAIIVTTVFFVLAHTRDDVPLLSNVIDHGPISALLAILWWRTRSLAMCVAVHAGYNLVLVFTI